MEQLAETAGARAAAGSILSRRRLWAVLGGLPLLFALVLFEVLAFHSGGYIPTSAAPVVIAFFVVLAVWAASRPRLTGGRLIAIGLAALGAFAVWSGVSTLWSLGPDLSWISFNYAALFTLVAASCAFARPGVWGLRLAGFGFLVAMLPVAVYAFLGKALPDVVTHAHVYARLAQPLGYWNVLAVLLVMATPVALATAARPGLPAALRAAAASALSLVLITFFFAFSRGGIVAMCVALVAYFAATRTRLGSLLTLVISCLPVALVLYHLRGLGTLYAATGNDALRTSQGHRLGVWTIVALAVVFVLQLAACLLFARWRPQPKLVRVLGWAVLAAVLVLMIGGPLVYMSARGGIGPWISSHYHTFVNGSPTEGDTAGRLSIISSNGRIQIYEEAMRGVQHNMAAGTGAGTFIFTNYRYRDTPIVVWHAHSQWVNVLSELGIVGLLLFATAILGLFAAAVRSLWRQRRHAERPLLAACFAAALAFAAHMSVDWDWDMAAATTAFLLLLTVVAVFSPTETTASVAAPAKDVDPAAQRVGAADADSQAGTEAPAAVVPAQGPRPRRLALPAVVLACGLPLLMAASWVFPYLSARAEAQAVSQADLHPDAAAASARRAHSLDPLAVKPLITLSQIQQGEGRPAAALATLRRAVRLQPNNYSVHYTLGVLLTTALHRDADAADQFRLALALNPLDVPSQYALDQVAQR